MENIRAKLLSRHYSLQPIVGHDLRAQLEGLNVAGSIKFSAAWSMINDAKQRGLIQDDTILIESTSGNLGVALAILAAREDIRFVCVVDPRCNHLTYTKLKALGATIEMVKEPDPAGGFLQARRNRVLELCQGDDRYFWLNQHQNHANSLAHYQMTAPELVATNPDLQVLFVGVGTSGTAMGSARYLRETMPHVRVVGIDTTGAVTFGTEPSRRLIPGLGAGVAPRIFDPDLLDDMVHVDEIDAIRMCRTMAVRGLLLGGSSGTVVAGAVQWLDTYDPGRTLVSTTIAPDMGDAYLATIYDDVWVRRNYPPIALLPLTAGNPPMRPVSVVQRKSPL